MGKLPAFQFYPGDWTQDTAPCSLAGKGAWIDIICALWRSQNRGTLRLSMVSWARVIRSSVDQATAAINELHDLNIADTVTHANGDVTVSCRRIVREENDRKQGRLRQSKFRESHNKRECNGKVTPPSSSSSSSSSSDTIQAGQSPGDVEFPEGMMKFWDSCTPKARERSSRAQVFSEWKRQKLESSTVAILAGLEFWNRTQKFKDGYAEGAHRFLKNRKWTEIPSGPNGNHDSTSGSESVDAYIDQMFEQEAKL